MGDGEVEGEGSRAEFQEHGRELSVEMNFRHLTSQP